MFVIMISQPLAIFCYSPILPLIVSNPHPAPSSHSIPSVHPPSLSSHPICSSSLPPSAPIPSVHPPSLPQLPSPLFILPPSAPIPSVHPPSLSSHPLCSSSLPQLPSHLFILPPSFLSSCDLGPVLDDHHLRGCLPLHRHSPVGTLHPVLLPRLLLREAEEGCGGLHLLHQ